MSNLPIVHMTLYKHGVGYYERRGAVEGEAIKLTFRREEMDDILKSLTLLDYGGGQVRGVDYDTPQSRAERLAGNSIILGDSRSLRDLLQALRGRAVELTVSDGSRIEGILIGLDEADEKAQQKSLVSILQAGADNVIIMALSRIEGVVVRDETAAADLRFFLETALGQETHRSITIRLSPGSHDLQVAYIAPAPTWRVSYRLVVDAPEAETKEAEALLQGWGIFDNRLEEDLEEISLSLTAGMPISFVYDLYTPHTPERPIVRDENRVAPGPIMLQAAAELDEISLGAMGVRSAKSRMRAQEMPGMPMAAAPAPQSYAESVASAAAGQSLGELFQYHITTPVTVGRGQSAMVPIVSSTVKGKKDLIYNGSKMATHPVATLRFKNNTNLTLEHGPVTVLESGEYVGEAVLPFTADQAEAVISYAVELGLHIKEEHQSESQLHGLHIKDGYLLQQLYQIQRTTYRLDNRTPQPKTVLIERQRQSRAMPFNMPEPTETTLDFYRYQVETQPGRITTFIAQERWLVSRREELRQQSYQGLQKYLDDKFLDAATYQKLKDLLDAWGEIAQMEQGIKVQEQRRGQIYQAQEQIQKNMGALSQDGEEGRLRGQYVKQLAASESQLTEIEQSITELQTQIKQKQAEIERLIAALG
ncbi:MAG: hypothetical protein H6631_11070 [Anaerolineaceae bacterium]|nr:hypothetical protein [Anaerolineaceae bacterium]MCB9098685.1 hypothetical protein [Anaerolineales bacterium]